MFTLKEVIGIVDSAYCKANENYIKLGVGLNTRTALLNRTRVVSLQLSESIDDFRDKMLFDMYLRPCNSLEAAKAESIRGADGAKDRPTHWCVRPDILEKAEEWLIYYSTVGKCLTALGCSAHYRSMPLDSALALIQAAMNLHQYKIYYDSKGSPAGLLTWGWLSNRTLQKLSENPSWDMHLSEWNEGEALCFRDIAVCAESAKAISDDLSGGIFGDEKLCYLLARDRTTQVPSLLEIAEDERASLSPWILSGFEAHGYLSENALSHLSEPIGRV